MSVSTTGLEPGSWGSASHQLPGARGPGHVLTAAHLPMVGVGSFLCQADSPMSVPIPARLRLAFLCLDALSAALPWLRLLGHSPTQLRALCLLNLLLALRLWSLRCVRYKLPEEQGPVGASPRHRDISSGPGSRQVPGHTWVGGMQPKVLMSVTWFPVHTCRADSNLTGVSALSSAGCTSALATHSPEDTCAHLCYFSAPDCANPRSPLAPSTPPARSPPSLTCRRAQLWVWVPVCRVTLPAGGEQVGAQASSRTPCRDHRKSE